MRFFGILELIIFLSVGPAAASAQQPRGILSRPAPSWAIEKWLNLPPGKSALDIHDYRGKVLYLFCFQSWCPGCHSHGFPTLENVIEKYEGNGDVAFIAVQTVFEGFASNTFKDAERAAQKFGLRIPVGHSGGSGVKSTLMRRYQTGGTPWTIIIDREGVVRFNDFRIDPAQAELLIDRLMKEPRPTPANPPLPASRSGLSLIGKPMDLEGLVWINTPGMAPPRLEGHVTLIRWWTDTCPYCIASLPALASLDKEYGRRGFQTLGVYHPKPPGHVDRENVIKAAARLGYAGLLATDTDWKVLRKNYLKHHPASPTSVSFLLDKKGRVQFVHPGPVFFASKDPEYRQANQDFQDLRRSIEILLNKPN